MINNVTDKGLPKAMVKPNILTHVIEGYVIQEAGEPFAVSLMFLDICPRLYQSKLILDYSK